MKKDKRIKVNYAEIEEYLKSKFPLEGCGFILIVKGRLKFFPCENDSLSPQNNFSISPASFLAAEEVGEIYAVVHSHVKAPYTPSPADVASQKIHGYPWLVVGLTDNGPLISWLDNKKETPSLYGRQFIWGVFDCFTFIRDWYEQEYGIVIPAAKYVEKFWEKGEELYLDNFESAGFVEVSMSEIQYGDIVLLDLVGGVTSHAGVYLGNNTIAHHIEGRLSSRDCYGQFYIDRTTKIVRHKDRLNAEKN